MRILIAEDDAVLADGLSRSLKAGGYAVDVVASGDAADTALAAQTFDLLILDVGLPKLSGLCLLYTSPSPRDAHESRMPSSA